MTGNQASRLTISHPAGEYDVTIGHNLLSDVVSLAKIDGPVAIITDNNVGPLHLQRCVPADCTVTIPAGENYKTLETVRDIYDQLLEAGFDRKGTIVSLGGGVVGDVAGFVAATYLRGVNFVQCPTTVLAMVDASVGAKTGVDLPQGKNLVGAFKQPVAVIADLTTLQTLPAEEYVSGMAEVVKHGLIASPDLLTQLGTGAWDPATPGLFRGGRLQSLVTDAIQVKRDLVQEDPYEQGRRARLNLGHTFAHAIELVSGFTVRHGEGVAMGLVAASHLSTKLGHCVPELQTRIEDVLMKLNLPIRIPRHLSLEAVVQAMGTDKKKVAGKLRFVLIREVGDVFLTADVPANCVLETLTTLVDH